MFIIDDIVKKLIDIITDSIKFKIKVKIKYIDVVDTNSGLKYKGINIINNSKKYIIVDDVKIKYQYLLDNKKISFNFQESHWLKIYLKSNDNYIFINKNHNVIINTNCNKYFHILIKIDNKKIIKQKIKL